MHFGYTGDMTETNENQLAIGELLNKRIIIATIAGLAWVFGLTVCALALMGRASPEGLNTLAVSTISGIMGFLAKTGLDKLTHPSEPIEVTNADGEPLLTESESDESVEDELPVASSDERPSDFAKVVRKK